MIYILQFANILALLGMLIVPLLLGVYFLNRLKNKSIDKEDLEVRVALLEKRIEDLEKYIDDSE